MITVRVNIKVNIKDTMLKNSGFYIEIFLDNTAKFCEFYESIIVAYYLLYVSLLPNHKYSVNPNFPKIMVIKINGLCKLEWRAKQIT